MRTITRAVAAVVAAGLLVALPAGVASAHETVGVGDLELVIGFGTEPAYLNQPNSVEVLVSHDGEPVTDLRPGDLQVEVTYGDASTTMDLEPNFLVGVYGELGDYRAWFVPSQPGDYTFRITGEVDGEEVDEEVTSGPETFSPILDTAEESFPPVDAPTNAELATRLEQETGRLEEAQAAAQAAADDASSARTIALIAILVGAIGVIAGIAGIAAARSRRPEAR